MTTVINQQTASEELLSSSHFTAHDSISENDNDDMNIDLEDLRCHVLFKSLLTISSAEVKSIIDDLMRDIQKCESQLHLQTIAAFEASQHDTDSISVIKSLHHQIIQSTETDQSTDIKTLILKVRPFKCLASITVKNTSAKKKVKMIKVKSMNTREEEIKDIVTEDV